MDHLLVFKGEGEIKDFPGNYSQYREWNKMETKKEAESKAKEQKSEKKNYHHDDRRRMTYKEKQEFEALTKEIDALEKEQKLLEEQLCSGTLSVEELTEKSKRLPQIKDELEEKEFRWLELSELK